MVKKGKLIKDKKGIVHLDDDLPDDGIPMTDERVAHQFTDYIMQGNEIDKIKEIIKEKKGSYDPDEHSEIFDKMLKKGVYNPWAKQKNIPKNLRESGWEHYLQD